VTWDGCGPPECNSNAFFTGEVEPCINGQVAAVGAYFRQDVGGIVDRLLDEQLPDGGWNCDAPDSSSRSSFNTTICVLEALLEYERTLVENSEVVANGESTKATTNRESSEALGNGETSSDGSLSANHEEECAEVTKARLAGHEYLLERRLFRRLSTGEAIERDRKSGARWSDFAFPTWWHYDVLRALEHLRSANVSPDPRIDEAIALVVSKRDEQGRWPLDVSYPGTMPLEIDDEAGRPSRWNTLRALRVLRWYEDRD
jgi:hypothetical protein